MIKNCYLSDSDIGMMQDIVNRYGENLEGFYFTWSRAYGGNIAFDRTKCINELLYDTNYIGYGGEDIDFSYQLYLDGFDYCYNSGAVNYHQEHKRNNNEQRELFNNFNYFYNKYPNLEVELMRMDWEGLITLDEANSLLKVLDKYSETLSIKVKEYISRVVKKRAK